MRAALARHDALLRAAIVGQGGSVFKTISDAFYAAFTDPANALSAALSAQSALDAEPLLHVRMALHTGAAGTNVQPTLRFPSVRTAGAASLQGLS